MAKKRKSGARRTSVGQHISLRQAPSSPYGADAPAKAARGKKGRAAAKDAKSRVAAPTEPAAVPLETVVAAPAWLTDLLSYAASIGLGNLAKVPLAPATLAAVAASAPAALAAVAAAPPSSDELGTRLAAIESSMPFSAMKSLPWKVSTAMDPRLQLAVANRRVGKLGLSLSSTTGDEVAVIARVKSVQDWEALPNVVKGCTLGKTEDNTWIVTGRVPVRRAESVRAAPTVVSLKASQPIHPALSATIPAMSVAPPFTGGVNPDGGNGVVVGIVDFGCDFAHRNFRNPDGTSRIVAIWNQGAAALPTSPFGYGREFAKTDIDAALQSPNPYLKLGYGPPHDPSGTHGTHVMDIAAGNGLGSTQPGVAPKADIIFVEAATSDIAWQGPKTVNQAFGDSVQLLEAVRFIFDMAGDRPCVCNLSLGTNGGPHDGSSLVEQGLDVLVREKENRAVVIAASNSQLDNIHTSGKVPKTAEHDIVFTQIDNSGGEFELWYPGALQLEVTLIAPDGSQFGPVQPGENLPVGANSNIAIFISNRRDDPNNHDNVINLWLAEGLPGDDFTVRVRSLNGLEVEYHAWMERNDRAQAFFKDPVPTHTLGSISTGHETVVVGSYNAHQSAFPLSDFSSCGPTRDGRNKPEVSAPGQFVVAAKSGTGVGVVRKSGTSMAAPAVAGLIALVFAEARRKGLSLSIADLREKLLEQAAINPPGIPAGNWDPRYGNGRANGAAIA